VKPANGDRVMPDPILVGRNADKIAALAKAHGVERWGTDLDLRSLNPDDEVFFDAGTTQMRPTLLEGDRQGQAHLLREADRRPIWPRRSKSAKLAKEPASSTAWCRTSCSCPGLLKLKMLIDSRLLRAHAARCVASSAIGCSKATCSRRSGPVLELPQEDGGGIILDMLCHWRYVLDNLFGEVRVRLLPRRDAHPDTDRDEDGPSPYKTRTADDAAYATFAAQGQRRRDRALQFQLGHARAPRRPGDLPGRRHPRFGRLRVAGSAAHAVAREHAASRSGTPTSRRRSNFFAGWQEVPTTQVLRRTASRSQWEEFIRTWPKTAPYYPWNAAGEGAKGVQLVEAGLQSS
jgi:hypothetical protein